MVGCHLWICLRVLLFGCVFFVDLSEGTSVWLGLFWFCLRVRLFGWVSLLDLSEGTSVWLGVLLGFV